MPEPTDRRPEGARAPDEQAAGTDAPGRGGAFRKAWPWVAAAGVVLLATAVWFLLSGRAEARSRAGTIEDIRRSAREREIARMIATLGDVRSATVLVGGDGGGRGGASVSLELREGAALSAETASAVAGLVASAVPGLVPEDVVVVDARDPARTHRLSAGAGAASEGAAALRLRREVERALADRLRALFAGMGIECVAVVSAEINLDRVEERLVELDPEGKGEVILREQRGPAPAGPAAAAPGTGAAAGRSAAPPGVVAGGQAEYREIEAEVSRLTKEVTKAVGALANVRASVVIFDRQVQEKNGTWKYDPSVGSDENIKKYTKLAARALGLAEYEAANVEVQYMKSAWAAPAVGEPGPRGPSFPAWAAGGAAVLALVGLLAGLAIALARVRGRREEAAAGVVPAPGEAAPEVPAAERLRRDVALSAAEDADRAAAILRRWIVREG